MIKMEIIIFSFFSLWPLAGFIPNSGIGIPRGGSAIELYIFCLVYGLILGSIQSYSRTTFAALIPPGQESEFYGLYEVTDKGSSWLGPAMVAIIFSETGDIRWTCFYLSGIMWLALYFVMRVDYAMARRDCNSLRMAMRLKALKASRAHQKRNIASFLSLNVISSVFGRSKDGRSGLSSTFSSFMTSSTASGASSFIASSVMEMSNIGEDSELQSEMQSIIDEESSALMESSLDGEDTLEDLKAMMEEIHEEEEEEEESDDEDEAPKKNEDEVPKKDEDEAPKKDENAAATGGDESKP